MSLKIFKGFIKIGFIALGVILLAFYLWYNHFNLQSNSSLDKIITYSTVTQTFSTPLSITPSPQEIIESISDFVIVPEGGLDWKILAETKTIPYEYKDLEGENIYGVKPEFSDVLKAYDNQTVIMQGYMFPLNADKDQGTFLFGPFPISCPYHYHVGPTLVIKAQGLNNIKFQYEPITIKGILELVTQDNEYNIFYRIKDVQLLK